MTKYYEERALELEKQLQASGQPFLKLGKVTPAALTIDGEQWGTIDSWKDKYDNAIAVLLANESQALSAL